MAVGAAAGSTRHGAWLVVFPALLPAANFYPWSGWTTFDEFDLLVLGIAAGGYARLPRRIASIEHTRTHGVELRRDRIGGLGRLVLVLFFASVATSTALGMADAGGARWGWFQGHLEPMNSVRLAKPFAWALLLWPLWRHANRADADRSAAFLGRGLCFGLACAATAALWERTAFPGLLNFSSNYRTVALFWETHVGGAALDGFLALTLPFAVAMLALAKGRWQGAGAAAVTLLGGYACLTTFSRGLYLALPVGLVVLAVLQIAQQRRLAVSTTSPPPPHGLGRALAVIGLFALAAAWLFPTSGYRGLLALIGVTTVLLEMPQAVRGAPATTVWRGCALGAVLSAAAWWASASIAKGAYVVYAALAATTLLALALSKARRSGAAAAVALGGCIGMVTGLVLVARHWGEGPGFAHAWPVAIGLLAATLFVAAPRRSAPWPDSLRWKAGVVSAVVLAAGAVGVLGGGGYMVDRFKSEGGDVGGRLQNWRLGIASLESPFDWAFGKGLGRFPAHYALASAGDQRPGGIHLADDIAGRHMVLAAGTHPLGWLELLRLSQRVDALAVPATVQLDVRSASGAQLHVEVCEKHLLYSEACVVAQVTAAAQPGRWQTLGARLEGNPPSRGDGYAPKLVVFSVGVLTPGARVEIDNLQLLGADGTNRLANPGFDNDMARWYFTSDGYHTPWHIEGIVMNALFDQGLIGVALLLAMWAGALWRLTRGAARDHALAPATAAALSGFVVVGLFSSVTDVPRVACLFYFFLLMGLGLRVPRVRSIGPHVPA